MIRLSGNILDIVPAICSRLSCALGFANQHRDHSITKGLCRTANSCKAVLIVGALRIACSGVCTAARFHAAEENPGCLLRCSTTFVPSGQPPPNVPHQRLSSMIYCAKLPFELTGSAFLWLACWTRLSSQLSMCGEPIGALVSISQNSCMAE